MVTTAQSERLQSNPHEPDWQHYAKPANKARIDEDARRVLEAGTLQSMGHPPGPTLEISARAICTILDKHPELATDGVNPVTGKPLTGAEKRRQRRFDRERKPDNVIEYTMEEGKDFRVIPNEEYVAPPPATYVRDGKVMPEGWEPISMESETAPNGSPAIAAAA